MITHENDGFYRNVKTGKVVQVLMTRHDMHNDGNIHLEFFGTRNRKRFGRVFHDFIESFMAHHEWLGKEAS